MSNSVLVGESWQISLDDTVGFPLKDGDQFNYKKLITGERVGNKQFYTLLVGYRIPWQSWKAFADAPTEFFDISKPKNGLNDNSSNYSTGSNWQIRAFIKAIVLQEGNPNNLYNS